LLAEFCLSAAAAGTPGEHPPPIVMPTRGEVRILVQSSPLAGIQFYTAKEWWAEMQIDDRLELIREPDNRHDGNAVRVEWKGHKLGYVPRRENQAVAQEMDRGTRLSANISKLQRHRSPWQRLKMNIYVLSPTSPDSTPARDGQ
jgi:hypothetical protein